MNRILSAVLASLCIVLLINTPAAPAAAAAPGDGGGPPVLHGDVDAINKQVLLSFTVNHRSVAAGHSVLFQWAVDGPAEHVTIQLDGEEVHRSGLKIVHPEQRDERHVLRAVSDDVVRELGAIVIGVDPCVSGVPSAAPQCGRPGAVRYDYAHDRSDFVYRTTRMVDPRTRPGVTLDACSTDPGWHGRIEQYSWTLRPLYLPVRRLFTSDDCRIRTDLAAGVYLGTLKVRASDGSQLRRSVQVVVKDLVVVSLGDSMASGEGNPDTPGDYYPVHNSTASWKEPLCHRSAYSGHVRAAQLLGADKHTGMVFLSLACSGADTSNLAWKPQGSRPPQIDQLRDLLCRWNCSTPIDLLIVSIGINDLGFSSIAEWCVVKEHPQSACDKAMARGDAAVPYVGERIRLIAAALRDRGIIARHVLINEYPVNVFNGGCAIRTGHLEDLGQRLNKQIKHAATAVGWTYVDGIVAKFQGHEYCRPDDGWFISWTTSLDQQGDTDGTAHPNRTGHRAIARRIVDTYEAVRTPDVPVLAQQNRLRLRTSGLPSPGA